MAKPISIDVAMRDDELFKPWFKDAASWAAWLVFAKALFAQPLSAAELAIFQACTGREEPSVAGYLEAWLAVGRRGGKSLILALIAVFLAVFRDWSPYLVPGERAAIVIICVDRRQCRTVFRYIEAMLSVPLLASLIDGEPSADEIGLTNGVSIEIGTCNFRSIRGRTVIVALLDEIAFWRSDDSANPDTEVINALRPAMASVPGAMMLCASSPYARRGVLYNAFKKNFGKATKALFWRADTATMNPTISEEVIAEAFEADSVAAMSEYGRDGIVEFRSDVEAFLTREIVESVTIEGRHELLPAQGIAYTAFVDPSGGSSDSMTLAVAHIGGEGRAVVDCVREWRPPFSPDAVVAEACTIAKSYRCGTVRGDKYAGEWPRERFKVHGVTYLTALASKSDLYRDALPLFNAGQIELLDHPRLAAQLVGLERRTSRGGKDSIDHAPGAHDDLANSICGAVVHALRDVQADQVVIARPILMTARGGFFPEIAGRPH